MKTVVIALQAHSKLCVFHAACATGGLDAESPMADAVSDTNAFLLTDVIKRVSVSLPCISCAFWPLSVFETLDVAPRHWGGGFHASCCLYCMQSA